MKGLWLLACSPSHLEGEKCGLRIKEYSVFTEFLVENDVEGNLLENHYYFSHIKGTYSCQVGVAEVIGTYWNKQKLSVMLSENRWADKAPSGIRQDCSSQ